MANTKIQSEQIEDDIALGGNPTTTTQSAGNNTTRVATTAFVTTAVANLVDSAPSALDTLNELAAAMGDDASFSTTITNSIATKLPLAGGTMTGNIAHASDFTLDVGGSITLDSDSGVIDFDDGGTNIGRIENASSDFKLESRVQDKDIVLIGNDGGVGVEALRLDMSAAGNVQARRARSNTAGEVALSVQPSDSTIHYGFRIDSNTNSFNLDRVDSAGQLVTVTTSANVGIGVAPSASHYETLEIGNVGSGITGRGAADTHILSGLYWDGASTRKYAVSGVAVGTYQITNGIHYWSSPASGTAGNTATVSANMALDASGNLGIGIASPAYTLTVEKTITNNWLSRIYNTGTAEGDLGLLIRTGSEHDGTSILSLYSGSSYKFKFQADGKLGIGTTSPESDLHVAKSASGSRGATIALDNTAGSTVDNEVQIAFLTDAGASVAGTANARMKAVNVNVGNGAADLRFHTWNGSAEGERLRIQSGGGISFNGDTAAANALDDYEESSFNTVLTGETSGTHSTSGSGRLTKIGRLASVLLAVDNVSSSSVSGNLRINLPVAYAGHDMYLPVQVYYLNYPNDTKTAYAYVSNGYTYILLYWSRDNNTSLAINSNDLLGIGGSYIRAGFSYTTS